MGKLIDMAGRPLGSETPEPEAPEPEEETPSNALVRNFMQAVGVAVHSPKDPITFIAELFTDGGEGGSFAVTVSFFPTLTARQTAFEIGAAEPSQEKMH